MILITRPKDDAKALREELKKLNFDSHIESMISFKYKNPKFNFKSNSSYLISSIQAVKALKKIDKKRLQLISNKNFFIIGNRVANELKKIGVKKINLVCEDSKMLIQKLKLKKFRNLEINYLCSNEYNKELKNILKKMNINIKINFIYRTIGRKKLTQKTIKYINNKKIRVVVFYSSYSAKIFMNLIKKSQIKTEVLKDIKFLCLSDRIKKTVKSEKFINVHSSKKPSNSSMKDLIEKIYINQ